jgi:hypothetical protein
MTQTDRRRFARVRSVLLPLLLVLGSGTLAACGSSSSAHQGTTTPAQGTTTSAQTSSTPTVATGTTGVTGHGSTGATSSNSGGTPPIARASSFVTCMRAHGVKLPTAVPSGSGATLDFKRVATHSRKFKTAIAACASKLIGSIHTGKGAARNIKVQGISIRGLHVRAIHIGHIEINIHVPNLHIGDIKVPPIHVTTPTPPKEPAPGGEPEA